MECKECNYTGSEWTVEVTRTYTGQLDSTNTVTADEDDYQQDTIVKCPECGAWNDDLSAEIEEQSDEEQ